MYKFFVIHIFICVVFGIYNLRKGRDEAFFKFVVALTIPVFGFAYFIFTYILKHTKKDASKDLLDYHEYIKEDLQKSLVKKVNVDKEINIVPVSEALVLNESQIKRGLLIDIVKQNSEEHISILQRALENSDTEISHYAATAITELKHYFITSVQEISVKYEKNKNHTDTLIEYVEIIKRYMDSNLLDERSYKKYQYIYAEKLSELLFLYDKEEKYFIEKIKCEIELENYFLAKEYCDKFLEAHKESEEPYIMYMEIYYNIGDYKSFRKTIDSLKKSNIRFSNKALNITRFWWLEDENE